MKKEFITLVLLGWVFVSCNDKKEILSDVTVDDTEVITNSSSNSIEGVYEGVLPCADCEGIEMKITLKEDHIYEIVSVYLDERVEGEIFKEEGTWAKEGNTIILKDNNQDALTKKVRVIENGLKYLDLDGNEITGILAENYILHKK